MKGKWKQNSKKKKGNVVLQKYMVAVDEFIKSKSGTEKEENDHGLRFVKKKSRKEQRKEKRKMKKAKMKNHYEGKKTLSLPPDDGENSGIPEKKKNKKMEKAKNEMSKANSSKSTSAPIEKSDNSKTPSSSKRGTKINKLQESRKMALLEANEEEDREIKKLERCLGLNRRKNKKSLPQSFVADGLDYILGMLDSGSSAAGMYDDDDDMDMAKENFEKLDENDPQLSDEDEQPEDEMASEGSDEDVGSFDDENEVDEEGEEDEDGDDEMVEEEEAEEEEMEDELDESDAADSDEEDEEEEADTLDTKTSGSKSETVSSETFCYYSHSIDILCAVLRI